MKNILYINKAFNSKWDNNNMNKWKYFIEWVLKKIKLYDNILIFDKENWQALTQLLYKKKQSIVPKRVKN